MNAKRLLIVDDDAALRQMLVWTFEEMGFQVLAAADCSEAERQAGQGIDFALLDYHLPDGCGSQLLKTLKQANPKLRAVLMSGVPSDEGMASAQAAGALRFLAKPIDAAQLQTLFNAAKTPATTAPIR